MSKFIIFMRALDDAKKPAFQQWYLEKYVSRFVGRPGVERLLVDVVTNAPSESPLGVGQPGVPYSPVFDLVTEVWMPDASTFQSLFYTPEALEPLLPWLSERCAYQVDEKVEIDRELPGTPPDQPFYRMVSRIRILDDLPDPAARRIWQVHANRSKHIHVGANWYSRNWIGQRFDRDSSGSRGVTITQFVDPEGYVKGFTDSERGLKEILHDGAIFVASSDRHFTYAVDPSRQPHLAAVRRLMGWDSPR